MDLSPIWEELYEHVAMYSPVWIVGSLGTETIAFPQAIWRGVLEMRVATPY